MSDESTPRPWPENAWPTAAELADWISRCTSDERLSYADHSLATAQRAARCVDLQHDTLRARAESAEASLAGVVAERDALREALRTGVELDNHHNAAVCPYCCATGPRAALAGLREGIETLADRWAGDPVGGDIWRSDAVDALRALLAPTPDHEEER